MVDSLIPIRPSNLGSRFSAGKRKSLINFDMAEFGASHPPYEYPKLRVTIRIRVHRCAKAVTSLLSKSRIYINLTAKISPLESCMIFLFHAGSCFRNNAPFAIDPIALHKTQSEKGKPKQSAKSCKIQELQTVYLRNRLRIRCGLHKSLSILLPWTGAAAC